MCNLLLAVIAAILIDYFDFTFIHLRALLIILFLLILNK